MVRPLRLEHPGALWHVTSRGNEKQAIFVDEEDRQFFLRVLGRVARTRAWRIHAYVLMGNHYHLLLETPEPTLSVGMRDLNGFYTQVFNRRHERVGHLLQGRFKSILVERESHLLELVRYIVLNPVRARLVERAGDWPWSNYRSTAGLSAAPRWLDVSWTISQFGGGEGARKAYSQFVADALAARYVPWREVSGQVFLGGEDFLRRMQRLIHGKERLTDVPRAHRSPARPTLAEIVAATLRTLEVKPSELTKMKRSAARYAIALLAREDGLLRLSAVGPSLGVGASGASRLALEAKRRLRRDAGFRETVEQIRAKVRGSRPDTEVWSFKT